MSFANSRSPLLPIIYSAHHASHDFGNFTARCALTTEQRVRFSDYGSDDTVPTHGVVVRGTYSRGLVDLNRAAGDPAAPLGPGSFREEDFGRPAHNKIWKERLEPSPIERASFLETIYWPFHRELLNAICVVDQLSAWPEDAPILVVAWDNTKGRKY